MNVELVACTKLARDEARDIPGDIPVLDKLGGFSGASSEEELLIEYAGRGCYESWDRPHDATRKTRDYVRKTAIEKGHESILEHASASFRIEGVSRYLTHELCRHRHLSFSQHSTRYIDEVGADVVLHPTLELYGADDADEDMRVLAAMGDTLYAKWVERLEPQVGPKRAREAARFYLPSALATSLTVTGNFRAWRHVIRMRGSEHADREICELALEILRQLYEEAPAVFGDFSVVTLEDGRQVIE